ncbi:hypothetical protein HZB01_04830 [Candidatus Woesearchaeota archaeon]|nr:hypothetical protein [Candidatus Woesearchaeota archaeon]
MNLVLTSSQERALSEIEQILLETPTVPTLIVLQGLSGVGKTTLERRVLETHPELHAVDFNDFRVKLPSENGYSLTTLIPGEEDYSLNKWNGGTKTVLVMGMTLKEATAYAQRSGAQEKDQEWIAQKSLGIPLLIEQIVQHHLTPGEATTLAVSNLLKSFGLRTEALETYARNPLLLKPFLEILPDRQCSNALLGGYALKDNPLTANMTLVLRNYAALRARNPSEPSPLLVAKKSYDIYQALAERMGAAFEIYAAVTQEQYAQIKQSLRLPPDANAFDEVARCRLFNVFPRKSMYFLSCEGEETLQADFERGDNPKVASGMNYFKKEHALTSSSGGEFYFAQDDHGGLSSHLKTSWMVESLLQQLGIPYTVAYRIGSQPHSTYTFSPEKKMMVAR